MDYIRVILRAIMGSNWGYTGIIFGLYWDHIGVVLG